MSVGQVVTGNSTPLSFGWSLPFNSSFLSKVVQPYGPTSAGNVPGHFHTGIDYGLPQGTPVYAIVDGTVNNNSNWTIPGYPVGWAAQLKSSTGAVFTYGHLSKFALPSGTKVHAGDLIGYSGGAPGTPGAADSGGAHLHFEVKNPSGKTVDPTALMHDLSNTLSGGLNDPAGAVGLGASVAGNAVVGGITSWLGSIGLRVGLFVLGALLLVVALWWLAKDATPSHPATGTLAKVSAGV